MEKNGDTFASPRNRRIHLLAVPIASPALDIALHQVLVDGIKNYPRHLSACGIVKKDECGFSLKSGKRRANGFNREAGRPVQNGGGVGNTAHYISLCPSCEPNRDLSWVARGTRTL